MSPVITPSDHSIGVRELQPVYAKGQLRSEQLVDLVLGRIAARGEDAVWISRWRDSELRQRAAELDRIRRERGPAGMPLLISGGSSSGSAVAVAAGLVSFALGTDTAGSERVSAAMNGIVGCKPTCGLVSTAGVVPARRSLDCVSIFTADAGDAATVLDIVAGHGPADAWSRPVSGNAIALIATHGSQWPALASTPAG
jgi:Asp-tRNA(Asn)/Glu-tRNA(Gln) amidotransferase A subunit family amidase